MVAAAERYRAKRDSESELTPALRIGSQTRRPRRRKTERSRQRTRRSRPATAANPGLAAVLALVWPGLGHVYCGHLLSGLLIMFLGWPLTLLFGLFMLALSPSAAGQGNGGLLLGLWGMTALAVGGVYIGQIYNAYGSAQSKNRRARIGR